MIRILLQHLETNGHGKGDHIKSHQYIPSPPLNALKLTEEEVFELLDKALNKSPLLQASPHKHE